MKRPDLRRYVGICTSCRNWQVDVRPAAIAGMGFDHTIHAVTLAHAEHLGLVAVRTFPEDPTCPGEGGRIKVHGQWVDPPTMPSGKVAQGTLALEPTPAWWVAR